MRLTITTYLSLDGVLQAPGLPDEDRSGGFELGGWQAPLWTDDAGEVGQADFDQADAFLFGRRSYEILGAYWPRVTDPNDRVAATLNALPKFVVSTRVRDLSWGPATLVTGDVVAELRALRERPGRELQVIGSGDLAQTLIRNDLIDEYRLWTYPVVLGTGKRLFADGAVPAKLRLLDTRQLTSGAVISRYVPDGALQLGSFGPPG
jgi:dihydrofolate reductase